MALNAGDIAIVLMNADTNKVFAFAALVDIAAGEVIKFTDNGWTSAGAFRNNEGIITWTATDTVTAGTVVTINTTGAVTATAGTVAESNDVNFSTSGDQVLAYQGDNATPTFLFAVNNEGAAVWQATAGDSNTSALPTGLTDGVNAVALTETDNVAYSGITTGTKAALLAAIADRANWTLDDAVNQTAPASFTVEPPAPITGTTDPETLDGTTDADTIVGGAGADTLNGDDGDDTFEFAAGDVAVGEEINGGTGTDTLDFQGGTHDLTGATLTSIENIVLSDAAGTTLTVSDLAQAGLISAADGASDVVIIADATATGAARANALFAVLNAGVEEIQYVNAGAKTASLQGAEMEVISADGLEYTFAFAAGVVTTATAVDTMGIRTWSSTVTDYDATGAVTGRTITNDNGLINDTDYVNGVRAVQTMTDTLGVATYQTLTRTFDAAGALVQTSKLADNGVQVIVGAAVAQTLTATAANDVLTGGAGADMFVFGLGASRDKVTDFAVAEDMLNLTAFGIDSTADLFGTATVRQQGANTRIDIDDLVLTLVNVDRDDLTDANFVAIV